MIKKRLSIILFVLFIIFLGAWYYSANKFEKMAKELLLSDDAKISEFVEYKKDDVVIEKFKFKVLLKDIHIKQYLGYIDVVSDQAQICYSPISSKISVHFNGNKLLQTIDDISVYIPSPDYKVILKGSILNGKFDNAQINAIELKSSCYLQENDEFMLKSDSAKTDLVTKLVDGVYRISLKTKVEGFVSNTELDYFKLIPEKLRHFLNINKNSDNASPLLLKKYRKALMSNTGPIDSTGNFDISISENLVNQIIDLVKGRGDISFLMDKEFWKNEKFSLFSEVTLHNNSIEESVNISFNIDNGQIDYKIASNDYSKYSNEVKEGLVIASNNFLSKNIPNANYEPSDFTGLSNNILDLNSFNFSAEGNFNLSEDKYDSVVNIGINKFKTEFKIANSPNNLVFEAKINNPKLLIDSAVNLYDDGIKSLLAKNNNAEQLQNAELIVSSLRNNGFDAIAVFHSGETLSEGDEFLLKADITPPFSAKVNGKNFLSIITDQRVQKFMKEMIAPNGDSNENISGDTKEELVSALDSGSDSISESQTEDTDSDSESKENAEEGSSDPVESQE